MINRGTDSRNTKNKSYKTYSYNKNKKNNSFYNNFNNNIQNTYPSKDSKKPFFSFFTKRRNNHYRGQNINPWRPFWQFITIEKKEGKRKISWFNNFRNYENVGNKIYIE